MEVMTLWFINMKVSLRSFIIVLWVYDPLLFYCTTEFEYENKRTVIGSLQIASRELGIPAEKIHTGDISTETVPNTIVTAGSMGTDLYGPAVRVGIP